MPSDSRYWMNKREILTLIGRSQEFFRLHIHANLSPEHQRRSSGRGRPLQFFAPAVVALMLDRMDSTEDALIAAGGPSAELERLRKARADLAVMEVREREGDTCRVAAMLQTMMRVIQPLKTCGERLQEQFGNDAKEILDKTLRQFLAMIEREFAQQQDTEGTGDDTD